MNVGCLSQGKCLARVKFTKGLSGFCLASFILLKGIKTSSKICLKVRLITKKRRVREQAQNTILELVFSIKLSMHV